jgi:hypothetical protein
MESEASRPTLAVFSHPNHEITIYGFLSRLKNLRLVYLTDGGGEHRLVQTREGLERLGLGKQAWFQNRTEASFYGAILKQDVRFFEIVAQDVASAIKATAPRQIICDSVEWYNPIHDLTLPIILKIVSGSGIPVWEVPLVRQQSSSPDAYAIQRPPAPAEEFVQWVHLSEEQLEKKLAAWKEVYTILAPREGRLIKDLRETARKEALMQARSPLRPPEDAVIRYDRRGEEEVTKGSAKEAITYEGHFKPLVEKLLGVA